MANVEDGLEEEFEKILEEPSNLIEGRAGRK